MRACRHRTATRPSATRSALVVAEVALALVLLASAGLLLRSLQRLFAVDPGFDASHLLTMQVQTAGKRFDKAATDRFFEQSLDAVRRVPGVRAAAFTSQLPLSGDVDEYGAHFEGGRPERRLQRVPLRREPRLFRDDGHPARARPPARRARRRRGAPRGRGQRVAGAAEVRDRDPIGQHAVHRSRRQPYTIVGVVGDVKQASLAASEPDAVYIPATQSWFATGAVARRPQPRRRGTPCAGGQAGDLVGRQGSADRARGDDGQLVARRRRSGASR